MTTAIIPGQRTYSLARDEEGHRDYTIVHLVQGEIGDGPYQVLNTPGLPVPGNYWIVDSDIDLWAWCRADARVSIHEEKEGDPVTIWRVEQRFSTKPPSRDKQRCQDQQIENPLLEPAKISGSGVKYSEEATHDRFNKPIASSSHEQLRGQQVEFDKNRPSVRIEMNVPLLNLALLASLVDCVNSSTMWGLPRRCIKLSNYTWERKFHGLCSVYYTWVLDFDINYSTFDRDLLDEGTKVLNGHWDEDTGAWVLDAIDTDGTQPDAANPQHFIRFKDRNDENARVVLNGAGLPAGAPNLTATAVEGCDDFSGAGLGAPQEQYLLTVNGVETGDDDCPDCSSFNGSWTLTKVAGECKWEGTTNSISEDATCDDFSGSFKWVLDKSGDRVRIYLNGLEHQMYWWIDSDLFLPNQSNIFAQEIVGALPQCTNWPTTVKVEPVIGSNQVGSIHIEKYDEANFAILGIPLSF